MQVVIPAAGAGTRLRPLTDSRPKALVDVAGKPILTHCFEQLLDLPITEIVVIVGYRGNEIIDHYGDSFEGVPLTYTWQQDQRGIAHALLQAESHVVDPFLLVNSDNVFRANLQYVVTTYRETGADGVVLVTKVDPEQARQTGAVAVEDDRVVGIAEKSADPPSTLVNAGCYLLPPAIFQACQLLRPGAEGEYQLSDAVTVLCHAGYEFVPVRLDGWRVNVNTPADIDRAEAHLRESQ